ncbi:MAG: transglutaminase domain-containing protein [Janthinobacterium lividum]
MPRLCFRWLLSGVLLGGVALGPLAHAQVAKRRPAAPVPYQAVDARMRQVPDSSTHAVNGLARYIRTSFATEADRARAAFVWVATTIRYDIDNQFLLEYERPPAEVIQQTLAQRRGVCRHYAELYSALANQVGVATYVVPGYGSLRAAVGHAWCASRIEGQWQLLDPTWAAGQVVNHHFVFQLHNEYYCMAPLKALELHMPFDPLWQLLPEPRTPEQFQQGLAPAPARSAFAFAFADSIALYERQAPMQRLHAANRRIEQNGVKNGLIYSYLANSRNQEANLYITTYNEALHEFNQGAAQVNAFVEYFNHQFQPRKPDAELPQLLAPAAAHFGRTQELLAVVGAQKSTQQVAQDLKASLQQAETKLRNCQAFLDRYLHTGKLLRPTLFMNISNLGGHNELMR